MSVDTYKPAVARAAIAAGASIVNDVSGLRDPDLAAVCADTGAALVLMHTASPRPASARQEPDLYGDVVGEVLGFLRERIEQAVALGVRREQLIVDPGPDFAKTPAQTIRLLGELGRLHELGRPLLMAISRKDFIGALTGPLAPRAPRRDAGRPRPRARARRPRLPRPRRCRRRPTSSPSAPPCASGADVGEDLALREEIRYDRSSSA